MSQDPICPKCGKAFREEDYCPVDGTPLLARAGADAAAAVEASSGEPGPEDTPLTDAPSAAPTPANERTPKTESCAGNDPADARGAPSGEQPPASDKRDRLADVMTRLGLRPAADRDTPRGRERPTPESASNEPPSPLPEAVLEKGWRIAGLVESRPGLHHWRVEWVRDGTSSLTGHYHRFRTGALTTDELYRRLEGRMTPQLARIWAHGTVNSGGAREDYELVSVPKAGRRLNQWCAEGTPSEQRARHLFPMLLALLEALADSKVRPLTLEPTSIQVTDDGELWLATGGMLTETSADPFYQPGLEHSALLPHGWSAPELSQENMVTPNAVVFSVGQLLALALWGQACSPVDLQRGAVPFNSISDAGLAQVLMGCLWPRSQGRWTVEELRRAVATTSTEGMPAIAPWDSLAPGASSTAFSFAGASHWRLETLLANATLASHWNEATNRVEDILGWAQSTSWVGQAKLLRAALAQGRSADWVLVALTRAVRPEAPTTWRGLDLSDAEATRSLAGLAQRALRGGNSDLETLRALFDADLRGAFAPLPPQS